jgi:putative ABC transport system permease protein
MFFSIVWRNLWFKPLNTTLSVVLLAFSTGIISLLLLLQRQLEQKFENDLRNVDLVVGAKGSPLQLVLSAIYHIDSPTGNINLLEAQKLMKSPMVKQAIPLSYGDSYKGYRILGTDTSYIGKYGAVPASGRLFDKSLEVVLGATVAERTGLAVGSTFKGTHGEAEQGETHEEHDYKVVGVLGTTNTILDNLIVTPLQSVWDMHDHPEEPAPADHKEENHDHAHGDKHDHAHEGHAHDDHDHEEPAIDSTREVTAYLVKFRTPMGIMTFPRMVNAGTSMQAAVPALEMNRLFHLMGLGITTLRLLALAIMLISGFSVFIALYNRLKERKYELALLRSLGSSRGRLAALLLTEGLVLAFMGFVLGLLLSRFGLWLIGKQAGGDLRIVLHGSLIPEELVLGGIVLAVGILAALVPAIKAWRMNLSEALSGE